MVEHEIKERWEINFGYLLAYLFIAIGIFAFSNLPGWYKIAGLSSAIFAILACTYEIEHRDYWMSKKKIVEHKLTTQK